MKRLIFVLFCLVISCTENTNEIASKNELTLEEFNSLRRLYFYKVKNKKIKDSTDLVIALKITNTINNEKRLLMSKNVNYVVAFNERYYLKIRDEFNFEFNSTDNTLYSKKLNMHLFPSNTVSKDDVYIINYK